MRTLFQRLCGRNKNLIYNEQSAKPVELASENEKRSLVDDDNLSEDSIQSARTISTSKTLRNMLKKTERLKGRFNELEDELMNIKKVNSKPEGLEKGNLGYYYADVKDISNDPDFL